MKGPLHKRASRFNSIATPANGDSKLRRLNCYFGNLGVLAEAVQNGVGQPGIGFQIRVKHAVKIGCGQ
jgi:hypothetical protein